VEVRLAPAFESEQNTASCHFESEQNTSSCLFESEQNSSEEWRVGELLVKTEKTMASGYAQRKKNNSTDTTLIQMTDAEGFFHTGDIVKLRGREIIILGRKNLSCVKLQNGKWFAAEELELKIAEELRGVARQICVILLAGELIGAVLHLEENNAVSENVWRNVLVKNGVSAYALSAQPLPMTLSHKLSRREIVNLFEKKMQMIFGNGEISHEEEDTSLSPVSLAKKMLKTEKLEIGKSFLENGGTSILAAQFASHFSDFSSALFSPLRSLEFKKIPENDGEISARDLENFTAAIPVFANDFRKREDCVFLTGATGFVGAHLLRQLQQEKKRVICLVRGKDGADRFRQRFAEFKELEVVEGSLEEEKFGLAENGWRNLTDCVTTVIHCGATVDIRASYTALRCPNVFGTFQMVSLARSAGAKLIHLSTMSASSSATDGYGRSKWLAESIVSKLEKNEGTIVRLPFVTFSKTFGHSNPRDWVTLVLRAALEKKIFPLSFPPLRAVELDEISLPQLWAWKNCFCEKKNEESEPTFFSCRCNPLVNVWSLDLFFRRIAARVPGARLVPLADFFSVISEESSPAAAVVATLRGELGGASPALTVSAKQIIFSDEDVDRHLKWLREMQDGRE
jgi:hypothetical protein